MFCGSCMQDNTLVRALRMAGADAVLLPTYTPIRVDEQNVAAERVFLGGINVYLDSRLPGWMHLPRSLKRWLDAPFIVRLLSRFGSSTQAADLGPLTVDMLRGSSGPCRAEIQELVQFISAELRPDVVVFSNALLSGVVPELRRCWKGRLICLFQGDDIFLKDLREPWRTQSLQLIRQNCEHFDGFLSHSSYYADFMSAYLSLDRTRFHSVPLAIEDVPEDATVAAQREPGFTTVGYFARICPEKGVFRFLEAAAAVMKKRKDMQFVIAGYLPAQYHRQFQRKLETVSIGAEGRVSWSGSPPDRLQKFKFLSQLDWLCVPAEYREPKGLYVLEAALAGVPCLLPDHGAFPERITAMGGGRLFTSDSQAALEQAMLNLRPISDDVRRGLRQRCLEEHAMLTAGAAFLQTLKAVLSHSAITGE